MWENDETEDILRQSSGGFTKDLPYPREASLQRHTAGFGTLGQMVYNIKKIGLGHIRPLF